MSHIEQQSSASESEFDAQAFKAELLSFMKEDSSSNASSAEEDTTKIEEEEKFNKIMEINKKTSENIIELVQCVKSLSANHQLTQDRISNLFKIVNVHNDALKALNIRIDSTYADTLNEPIAKRTRRSKQQ